MRKTINYTLVDDFLKENPTGTFRKFKEAHSKLKISVAAYYARRMLMVDGKTYPSSTNKKVSSSITETDPSAKQIVNSLAPRSKHKKKFVIIVDAWMKNPNLNMKAINKQTGVNVKRTIYSYIHKLYFKKFSTNSNIELKQRRKNLQYTVVDFIGEVNSQRELINQLLTSINLLMKANLQLVEVTYPEKGYEIRHYTR